MTDLRALLQQALEALDAYSWEQVDAARVALRKALEQPEQEPVAWMVYTLDGKSVCVTDNPTDFGSKHKALPLYTAPPQRKPLTEEEIYEMYNEPRSDAEMVAFARAVERAHGIGGQDE